MEMSENCLKLKMYKTFWFSALMNLAVFLLISYLMPIRFEELDDTTLLLFSSGAYTGTPDAHLVYINYIYGLFVSFLYGHIGGVEWYTVCFAVVHVVSLSIITWRFFNANIHTIWKTCGILLLYFIEMHIILNFQFTTTAALCATAAIVLFLFGNKIQQYCAILLFALASLIRLDAASLALLICVPSMIYYMLEQEKKMAVLITMSFFLILPAIGVVVDKKVYDSDPEWKEYTEYNGYRGAISDNPTAIRLTNYPTFADSSDYILFRDFFPDVSVVDNQKAKEIYEYINDVSFTAKLKNIYTKAKYPINLRKYRVILIFFIVFTIFLFVFIEDKRKKYLIAATTFLLLLLLSYVCMEGMIKHRVFYSALIPYSLILVAMCSDLKRQVAIRSGVAILLGMVAFLGGDLLNKRNTKVKYNAKAVVETVEILKQSKAFLKEGEMPIAYLNAIVIEGLSPYSISEFYKDNRYAIINWTSKIPFNKGYMDSFLDIVDKNPLLVTNQDLEFMIVIQQNILINHGVKTELEILTKVGDLNLLRIKKLKEDIDTPLVVEQ